jgi:hypothetical protein
LIRKIKIIFIFIFFIFIISGCFYLIKNIYTGNCVARSFFVGITAIINKIPVEWVVTQPNPNSNGHIQVQTLDGKWLESRGWDVWVGRRHNNWPEIKRMDFIET